MTFLQWQGCWHIHLCLTVFPSLQGHFGLFAFRLSLLRKSNLVIGEQGNSAILPTEFHQRRCATFDESATIPWVVFLPIAQKWGVTSQALQLQRIHGRSKTSRVCYMMSNSFTVCGIFASFLKVKHVSTGSTWQCSSVFEKQKFWPCE